MKLTTHSVILALNGFVNYPSGQVNNFLQFFFALTYFNQFLVISANALWIRDLFKFKILLVEIEQ